MRDDTYQHEPHEIEPIVPLVSTGQPPIEDERRPAGADLGTPEPVDTGYATPATRDREEIEPMVPDLG